MKMMHGAFCARLLEQVAHPRGADPDEHLDEFRAVDREERHAGLAGDGARQQRLAGAGRADQQHAFRDPPAEPAVALRVLQKRDDLLQFGLGLVDPGDIVEGRLGVGLDIDLGLAAADRHQPAEPGLVGEAAVHEIPDAEEQPDRDDPRQQVAQERALDRAGELDVVFRELAGDFRIDPGRDEIGAALARRAP